jgi:hypothetical protein
LPPRTDNIAKWAVELAEFELDFVLRHEIKSQMFADFIVDWTPPASHPGGPNVSEPGPRAPVFTEPHLTLFFDDSRKQGAGVRYWSSPLRGGGGNSSIWCAWTSKEPTTWWSTKPFSLG